MVRTDAIRLLEKEQLQRYNLLEFRKDAPNEVVLKKMGNRYFVYETNEKSEIIIAIIETIKVFLFIYITSLKNFELKNFSR